jgi:hypothetical protein
MEVKME